MRLKKATLVASSTPSVPPPAEEQAAPDPYLGATIDGRYVVEAQLGEGGMGVVYRCTHKIIGKKVAMKVLRADMARDHEITERFLNEARAASAIGNPHIIDISDFGQLPDGSTYFVMEFLDGIPLTKAVEGQHALPLARLLNISRQLADGLAAAHDAGIVHRDLKPDNIFLINRGAERDFVKILDFGIAKVSSTGDKLTRAGAVFGTPHYMSPEQAAGAPIDHRCDIYSFGVILYELSSGRLPFDADNFMGILTQHMYKAPVPIRALVPAPNDVPPGLEAIVLKCLSKRPEQRYQTMRDLLADLERLHGGLIPNAVHEMMERSSGFNVPADYFASAPASAGVVPGLPRPGRSKVPLIAGGVGALVAVGLVLAIFVKSGSSGAGQQPSAVASTPSAGTATPPPTTAGTPTTAQGPTTTSVALAIEPLDAHVFEGSRDLGASPVILEVPEGQTLSLEVRKDGYVSRTISVDGSKPRHTIKLDPEPQKGGKGTVKLPVPPVAVTAPGTPAVTAPKPPGDKPKTKPPGGGDIIENPWGN